MKGVRKSDHNQIDDPVVVMPNNCVLILIGKFFLMIVILIRMLVNGKEGREGETCIHSFSTHQGVFSTYRLTLLLCIPLHLTVVFGD